MRERRGNGNICNFLVDLFNILKSLCGDQDVADNIPAFKLLLKYPKLTPYMFAFVEMKPKTLKAFAEVASHYYGFRDDANRLGKREGDCIVSCRLENFKKSFGRRVKNAYHILLLSREEQKTSL